MRNAIYVSLVLLCALFVSCSSKSPGAAAKKYMEYVKEGDYEKFADGLLYKEGSSEEKITQSKATIVALLKEKIAKEMDKKGGVKEIEVVSETLAEDGKTADVVLKTIYGDGSTEDSDFKMILKDGTWKMDVKK